jgi:hypothetical protein
MSRVTSAEAALARSDRYLHEVVERMNLCPFARRCRETGKLARRVLLGPPEVAGAMATVAELEALPADAVEVALLIFPDHAGGARAFEAFCTEVRDAMVRAHGGGGTPFYCVAFHPELPEDLADEHRAVGFIRRSPDPTLQLVRARLLEQVRGENTGGSVFIDAKDLTAAELLALAAPVPLSDRIARANLEALRREGPEQVQALLDEIRRDRR